ncbi:MAG TPA: ribonuclease Y [Actinobacteria bacterium]|nr:ribonuclease Y [Actinomycetes bacterium]HEX21078.1 ribonuclease Y [Actinomycetota bacterium]
MVNIIIGVILGAIIGAVAGFFVRRLISEAKIKSAEDESARILGEAGKKAEAAKKEAIIGAKDQIYTMRQEAEKEAKERRSELHKLEKRIGEKESNIDKRANKLEEKERELASEREKVKKEQDELTTVIDEQKKVLENIAALTSSQAKELLLKKIEDEVKYDAAVMIRNVEAEAREEAEKRARSIITLAIQRCAADHTAATTVSVLPLPNDEMKGRIIGREGRNIRAFETVTGINLIIDDTPEAVILSSFDPVRREIARLTLDKLITDGRIHPARIEEIYQKSKVEVDNEIREAGEKAVFETGVHGLHPELVRVLGRLRYRTSYGQNVLQHSIEVAHLAAMMAAELNADEALAKRSGLLHDIGKAIDHEVEGPHAVIGADLAKRLNESPVVCHPIEAHHADVEPKTIEAILVQSADAISASRPGARREMLENYIKRLEKLETLAESYKGVEKSYAMQAGREIRIMVKPGEIDDNEATLLAREIAKDIEEQLQYPGQIKVIVIRENRSIEYAK